MMEDKGHQISPDYLPAIQCFQRTFSRYFPQFEDDLVDAFSELVWLNDSVFVNPKATVRRSKAKRELTKIRSSLAHMGEHDLSYWQLLATKLYRESERGDEIAKKADEVLQFLLRLNDWQMNGELAAALDRFAIEAEMAIESTPEAGNINWDAVHAVDCLRALWWRNIGKHGPSRALNPASEFAAFLRDAFDYLKIHADPISAFKRWADLRRFHPAEFYPDLET